MRGFLTAVALCGSLLLTQSAHAVVGYFEGFEDPAFTQGLPNWADYNGGAITRATSGTNGINSSSGVAHGVLTDGNGPFTQFGGYSNNFGTGFVASLDIYLDPTVITTGTGFDYSVAVSNQAGVHRRDFIFHVGNVGGSLLVNGSNNTDAQYNSSKINNENGGYNVEVTDAGWYTFEHVFRDNAGALAVDLNLYDSSDNLLWSVTRTNAADDIATIIGGNRYGWFTYNDIDGLAIDNTSLNALVSNGDPVPEPATAAMGIMALAGLAMASRRRRA